MESIYPGFHAYGYQNCYKDHAAPVTCLFPIERLFQSLSDVKSLDFDRLWTVLALSATGEDLSDQRQMVYDQTDDPHPKRIFNVPVSSWYGQLLMERLDSDVLMCTSIGSRMFAEVGSSGYDNILVSDWLVISFSELC